MQNQSLSMPPKFKLDARNSKICCLQKDNLSTLGMQVTVPVQDRASTLPTLLEYLPSMYHALSRGSRYVFVRHNFICSDHMKRGMSDMYACKVQSSRPGWK